MRVMGCRRVGPLYRGMWVPFTAESTGVLAKSATGTQACPLPFSLSASQMNAMLPLFGNSSVLPNLGFTTTNTTTATPATPPLPGAKPTITYPASASAPVWVRSTTSGSSSSSERVQIDPSTSRIIMVDSRLVDASAGTTNETQTIYGNLDVYDAAAVSASVFSPSTQAQGICHA